MNSLLLYSSFVLSVGIVDDFKTWLHEKLQSILNIFRDFFFELFKSITEFFKVFLTTLYDALKDFFLFCFDSLLTLLVYLLESLGTLFDALDFTSAMSDMPADVLNIMGLLGLGNCMSLIVTSLIIRITLQMIPFTRLGS